MCTGHAQEIVARYRTQVVVVARAVLTWLLVLLWAVPTWLALLGCGAAAALGGCSLVAASCCGGVAWSACPFIARLTARHVHVVSIGR